MSVAAERMSRANSGIERRASPREPVLLPALIVEADGQRRPCVIVDRSTGGLRISLSDDQPVPDSFSVVDLVTGVGREVEVAWRALPMVGVRTLQECDLRAPADAFGENLRKVWIAVLG